MATELHFSLRAKPSGLMLLLCSTMAVQAPNVESHQITAVYESMLLGQSLRFVHCDDPAPRADHAGRCPASPCCPTQSVRMYVHQPEQGTLAATIMSAIIGFFICAV
jgi:hypothetical protein